jgi:hypothetical protein
MSEHNMDHHPAEGKAKTAWAKRKFQWLWEVAKDPTLRGLPSSIAMALAGYYLNSKSETAYMGQDTLAADLKANPRSIQDAFGKLIKSGKLGCEVRRGRTNRYWMLPGDGPHTVPPDDKGTVSTPYRDGAHTVGGTVSTPYRYGAHTVRTQGEPGKNPGSNPERDAADAAPLSAAHAPPPFGGSGGAGPHNGAKQDAPSGEAKQDTPSKAKHAHASRRKTPFPPDWECSIVELEVAEELCPHWDDVEYIIDQFDKFRVWHRIRGIQFVDWDLAWCNWCERGKDYDAKHQPKEPKRRASGTKRSKQKKAAQEESAAAKDAADWVNKIQKRKEAEEAANPYATWNPDDDDREDD